MTILVTGSSGLIGQHVISLLLGRNMKVVGYDRTPPSDRERHFTFEQGELADFPRLATVMQKHKIDTIVHSGGISHPIVGSNSPNHVIQTNVVGSNYIFEAAKLFHVKKVIYTSSGAVYGNNRTSNLQENEKPTPTSIYGVSKVSAEYLAQVFAREFALDISVLRLPFVYGPGRRMPDPISDCIHQVRSNEEMVVDTSQKLEYIYVKDVAHAIWNALQFKDTNGEIFNIGTGHLTSTKEITDVIREIFPHVIVKETHEVKGYDEMGALNCSKAKKILRFTPQYALRDGIQEYAQWVINNED